MFVAFYNENDNREIYYGTLMTSPKNINEHTLYVDALDCLHVITGKLDWKNNHVNDVAIKDVICFADSLDLIKDYIPEYFV